MARRYPSILGLRRLLAGRKSVYALGVEGNNSSNYRYVVFAIRKIKIPSEYNGIPVRLQLPKKRRSS